MHVRPGLASLATLVERLGAMDDPNGAYGADGPAARVLLTQRGLTDERLAEAKAMLDQLGTFGGDVVPPPSAADPSEIEAALWSWYLEWSGIARAVIRDRRLLRALGFLQGHGGSVVDDAGDPAPVEPAAVVEAPVRRLSAGTREADQAASDATRATGS
ncbi:MAG TPA: hypothetical protein VF331_16860 [Polyangiales bacterium]